MHEWLLCEWAGFRPDPFPSEKKNESALGEMLTCFIHEDISDLQLLGWVLIEDGLFFWTLVFPSVNFVAPSCDDYAFLRALETIDFLP